MSDFPDVHFGTANAPDVDWRKAEDDADPDDELLERTSPDVVAMLGFDPLEDYDDE